MDLPRLLLWYCHNQSRWYFRTQFGTIVRFADDAPGYDVDVLVPRDAELIEHFPTAVLARLRAITDEEGLRLGTPIAYFG